MMVLGGIRDGSRREVETRLGSGSWARAQIYLALNRAKLGLNWLNQPELLTTSASLYYSLQTMLEPETLCWLIVL